MKYILPILISGILIAFAGAAQSPPPDDDITPDIKSLEAAYPNEMYILRTPDQDGDIIRYEVRSYNASLTNYQNISLSWDIVIIVHDDKGATLFKAQVNSTGISTKPPSKERFRSFNFSVHKNLESSTAIIIGTRNLDGYSGTIFSKYRLPLKTIDIPQAHR